MAKFKVGDIIKANKKSNERYIITTQKNGWTGTTKLHNRGLTEKPCLTGGYMVTAR